MKIKTKVETTKDKIKEAFIELYSIKNIENISIKDITDLAGYNRGTFYIHYCDIYALLKEIEDELLEELMRIRKTDEVNIYESLESFMYNIENQIDYIIEKRKYFKAIFLCNNNSSFEEKIKLSMKKGSIDRFGKVDSEINDYIVELFASANISLIKYWLKTNMTLNKNEITDILYKFATNNISFWEN